MHKLLSNQLRNATRADGSVDSDMLVSVVDRSYDEFDRERRLNDRLVQLMEEDLKAANDKVKRLGELRLSETLESTPNPLFLVSAALTVQNINSPMLSICSTFGLTPRRGDKLCDILAVIAPDGDTEDTTERLLAGDAIEMQISGRWYLSRTCPMTDGGYAVSFSDVTALKDREAALALAKDAAESANRLKSKFLATMSHELRTPLNAIIGFSELIQICAFGRDPQAWARYCDYAESINSSGRHLLALINDVLDLSKIDSGSYRLHLEPVDVLQVLREAMGIVQLQAERGGVRLLPIKQQGHLVIWADSRAVKQVVLNLLSNAVKFTPEGGEVEVRAQGDADKVDFSVRDTGIGIDESYMQTVFEPFHQGDPQVARRFEGTGLGLSITRGLVDMHGGSLVLESELNVGTMVRVRWPCRAAMNGVVDQGAAAA